MMVLVMLYLYGGWAPWAGVVALRREESTVDCCGVFAWVSILLLLRIALLCNLLGEGYDRFFGGGGFRVMGPE